MKPKWLYRLESTNPKLGLWYNENGDFVLTLAELKDCKTKDLPMGFDERYKQGGKDWFSSCSNIKDLTHWYSVEDAKTLLKRGFRFSKYLATDYVEYDMETVFLKETCLDRVTLSIEEVFGEEGSYGNLRV